MLLICRYLLCSFIPLHTCLCNYFEIANNLRIIQLKVHLQGYVWENQMKQFHHQADTDNYLSSTNSTVLEIFYSKVGQVCTRVSSFYRHRPRHRRIQKRGCRSQQLAVMLSST